MAIHAQNSVSLNTKPAKTSLLGGHFIYRVDTSQGTLTPSSANIIENVNDSPTLWGYNTHIGAGGVKLRYNQIDLSTWTKDGVTLYYPKYNSSNIPIQGDAAAILNTTGLKIQKGGVIAGTAGQNGFVYLSSEDYQLKDSTHNGFTINGHTPTAAGTDGKLIDDPAWREIIGTKFGVDSEGNLYASNANISGKIIATEGEIGGCTIDSNGHLIVPSAYINGTLTVTTIEGGTFNTNNYIRLSSEDSQTISIGNSGNKTDWRIIAGNTFGVDKAGNLYATSAHISGEIEATTGLIGGNDGWHIGTNAIYSGNHSTYNTANVNGIFLGKESNSYYISGGPSAKWWIKDDGTFQLGTGGISYDGSTVTFGSNVTMPTLTVDTITGGTVGTNGFIYLSKNDYGSGISVGGSASKTDWKLIAGSKFGVDDEGNLYANNVNITGDIYSTGGSTGGFTIDSTSIHTTGVEVTSNASNSVALSSSTFTRTVNSTSRSNLKFAIGSKFAVANDGTLYANGAYITNIDASQITTGTLSASRIDTSSITLSKIQSGSSNYAQITSSGLQIYANNNSASYVASFGSTATLYSYSGTTKLGRMYLTGSQLTIGNFIGNASTPLEGITLYSEAGDNYNSYIRVGNDSDYYGYIEINQTDLIFYSRGGALTTSIKGTYDQGDGTAILELDGKIKFNTGWTNYGNLGVYNANFGTVSLASVSWVQDKIDGASGTNTKNTAGTTSGSGNRLYLIGAQDISGNYAQTYVNNKAYISTAGNLYSGEQRVVTTSGGTSGYLAKWTTGGYDLVNGPALGSSTTTFLRNDGTWAALTTAKTTSLSYGTTSTIATIGGVDIKVTMPSASGGSSSGVSSITITKGEATTKSSATGAVSFSVPGGSQHINKNDSAGSGYAVDFANASSGDSRGATLKYVQYRTPNFSGSDIRLKENIIEPSDKLILFYQELHPIQYNYKLGIQENDNLERRYGFIAQEIEEAEIKHSINTSLVHDMKSFNDMKEEEYAGSTYKGLDYNSFHALHVLYAKFLEKRITILEEKIQAIQNS